MTRDLVTARCGSTRVRYSGGFVRRLSSSPLGLSFFFFLRTVHKLRLLLPGVASRRTKDSHDGRHVLGSEKCASLSASGSADPVRRDIGLSCFTRSSRLTLQCAAPTADVLGNAVIELWRSRPPPSKAVPYVWGKTTGGCPHTRQHHPQAQSVPADLAPGGCEGRAMVLGSIPACRAVTRCSDKRQIAMVITHQPCHRLVRSCIVMPILGPSWHVDILREGSHCLSSSAAFGDVVSHTARYASRPRQHLVHRIFLVRHRLSSLRESPVLDVREDAGCADGVLSTCNLCTCRVCVCATNAPKSGMNRYRKRRPSLRAGARLSRIRGATSASVMGTGDWLRDQRGGLGGLTSLMFYVGDQPQRRPDVYPMPFLLRDLEQRRKTPPARAPKSSAPPTASRSPVDLEVLATLARGLSTEQQERQFGPCGGRGSRVRAQL